MIEVTIKIHDDAQNDAQLIPRCPNGNWEFGHYNGCVPALFRKITILNKTLYCVILVPHTRFMNQCRYAFEYDGRIIRSGAFFISELDEQKDFLESLIQRVFENPLLTGLCL